MEDLLFGKAIDIFNTKKSSTVRLVVKINLSDAVHFVCDAYATNAIGIGLIVEKWFILASSQMDGCVPQWFSKLVLVHLTNELIATVQKDGWETIGASETSMNGQFKRKWTKGMRNWKKSEKRMHTINNVE